MHYLYIGRNIVIIFVELVEVAVTAGVGPPVMLIGEGVLISSQDGFTAVLPGWSELCSSNHVEAGSLPGPISNQFYFVFVVIVPSFYILITRVLYIQSLVLVSHLKTRRSGKN